jgi:hypothetical protein
LDFIQIIVGWYSWITYIFWTEYRKASAPWTLGIEIQRTPTACLMENYNDYHGLNGGTVCELPIYNSFGNVTGFRQGNC